MAKAQSGRGHTDIPHEIAERMAITDFCASETRCIWVLFRKSWGWHKKTAIIKLSEWQKRTELKRQHIWRALARLELRQIITKIGSNEYAFQKDYEKWLPPIKDFGTKNGTTYFSTKIGTCYTKIGTRCTKIGSNEFIKAVGDKGKRVRKETLKRNFLKETKPSCRKLEISDELLGICDNLRRKMDALILRNKPDYRFRGGVNRPDKWTRELGRMIERDGRSPERIGEVMEWALNHPFWRANILSPHKLRMQFDALELRMGSRKSGIAPKDWLLLATARSRLEKSCSREAILSELEKFDVRLHNELRKFLDKTYPQGHSYYLAKEEYEKRHDKGS